MKISAKQTESICALDDESRYRHFIKKVADWEEVYIFYESQYPQICYLWPAFEYAELYMVKHAKDIGNIEEVGLENFMLDLEKNRTDTAFFVFPTEENIGYSVSAQKLQMDLNGELENYE